MIDARLSLPPPPAVVLPAELEVDHDDGNLGAGDGQDDEHEKQKPEQVVELVLVDRGEDEEELDEAGAEGEDTGHQGADHGVHVPHLGGDLEQGVVRSRQSVEYSRYLVGSPICGQWSVVESWMSEKSSRTNVDAHFALSLGAKVNNYKCSVRILQYRTGERSQVDR